MRSSGHQCERVRFSPKKAGLKRALQLFAPPVDVYLTVEVDRLIGAAMVLQVGNKIPGNAAGTDQHFAAAGLFEMPGTG